MYVRFECFYIKYECAQKSIYRVFVFTTHSQNIPWFFFKFENNTTFDWLNRVFIQLEVVLLSESNASKVR